MPELPEVETIRRGLEGFLVGGKRNAGKILKVKIDEPKSFIGEASEIIGARVVGLRRFGKALVVDLENAKSLIIHLRMTGQLIWRSVGVTKDRKAEGENKDLLENSFAGGHPSENFVAELPNKQTRVEIEMESGTLFFNDQRKFGFIKVVETKRVGEDSFIGKLAKEPWKMTGEELYKKLQKHKGAPIKSVILDQTVIAGLGNIYADEALFFAQINPKRKAGEVREDEAERLVVGARTAMERSLEAGGSTMRNYLKSDGTRGDYLELFARVFNKQGKECEKCGTKIVKTKVGGRGTHFCPKCQKY